MQINSKQNMEETKTYRISAAYKKATYQTEEWNNCLSNGKKVVIEITTVFRRGEFEIELSQREKEEITKKDEIILNDYNASCNELWDGCDMYQEVRNEDNLTPEERKELHKLMYMDKDDPENYDEDSDDRVEEDLLEANGWSMDNTIYGISCPYELEEI